MLVLSRHRDESIIIGDNIVVTIVDIRGDKVRLGIDAPSTVPVHRQEVYEAIQRENRKESLKREEQAKEKGPGDGERDSSGRDLSGRGPSPVGEGVGKAAATGKQVVQEAGKKEKRTDPGGG